MSKVFRGRVKWFATSKQPWGFIRSKDNGTFFEVFVHYKNILPDNQETRYFSLSKGDWVEFEIGGGYYTEGTQALKVKKLANQNILHRQNGVSDLGSAGQVGSEGLQGSSV